MNAIRDFEDILELFNRHGVKYLIVGGLAFIYHAKPRYTKDMDLWIEGTDDNITLANRVLAEFGSPTLLDYNKPKQILQIGLAPNRIDILVSMESIEFDEAWQRRITSTYGGVAANWIDIDSLLKIKSGINKPRHQEDARVLRQVKNAKKRQGCRGPQSVSVKPSEENRARTVRRGGRIAG